MIVHPAHQRRDRGLLTIRLSAREREELERQAREEGRSLSDLVRIRCGLPAARKPREP